jgi:hypothetical protein
MIKLSSTGVGRAGEFMAASKFQMVGLETAHVAAGSCDLHVTLPSKRVLRVEVKSSIKPTRSGSFKFNRGGSNADLFVFCCIPLSLIRIFSNYQLKGHQTTTLRPAEFTEQAEADDIAGLFHR